MIGEYKVAALCLSKISAENVQDVIYPLSRSLEAIGWKLTVYFCGTDLYEGTPFDEGEAAVYKLIDYRNIDALIIYDRMIHNKDYVQDMVIRAKMHDKPVIMIRDDEEPSGCIDVIYDEGEAFATLVDHLVTEHGVKNVACIAGRRDHEGSNRRIAVVREVLGKHNMTLENDYLKYGDFYDTPALAALDEILAARESLPDAIICLNDTMAIAVCNRLMELGYDVPEDVIVTGFDGIRQGELNYPKITTCIVGENALAKAITEVLQRDDLSGSLGGQKKVSYMFEPRQSCGCGCASLLDVNDAIHSLYTKTTDNAAYEDSMNNMLSRISCQEDIKNVAKMLKYYINGHSLNLDAYLCLNYDTGKDTQKEHTYDQEPFSNRLTTKRYFKKETEILSELVYREEVLPNLAEMMDKSGALLFSCVHDQEKVMGYMAAVLPTADRAEFDFNCIRFQRFMANLDNGLSLFVQQSVLREANKHLLEIQDSILMGFAELVEARDAVNGHHIKRTGEYTRVLVEEMAKMGRYREELSDAVCEMICKAAPLHDIGKVRIPDAILNKRGRLNEEEYEIMKSHTQEGAKIIRPILAGVENREYLKIAQHMALHHHERWDGSGYPMGLSGEQIPLGARIMAVVDVFDAICSQRVYKEPVSLDRAFQLISQGAGTHFDPEITDAFMTIRPEIEAIYAELD